MTTDWSTPTQPLPDGTPGWGSPTPPSQPPKPPLWRRPWVVITGCVIVGLTALGVVGSTMDPVDDGQQPQPTVTAPDTTPVTKATATTTGAVAAPKPTEPPTTAKPEPKLTMSQEQAIGTAESYLDSGHFSRSGLIGQLKFEGFSKADATFAVDHLHVNWREQAVGTAEDYLDTGNFSRSSLIEQLEFEGFSRADAAYAASKVGL